jgi:hypothetical protein
MTDTGYFWLIFLTALVLSILGGHAAGRRRKPLTLRPIRGYQAMPLAIAESIESNRRVHLSPGSAGIGQPSTLVALAALTLVYELAEYQAFTPTVPLVSASDPITLAAAQDSLRRAYLTRGNLQAYYYSKPVVWYPQGERSLAFGAGVASLTRTENLSSNILLGTFGPELAFIGEASMRQNAFFIGHSTQPEGQAIAYAQADAPLIGEELFVGDAYLEPTNAFAAGRLIALDALRWVMIVVIILVAIFG